MVEAAALSGVESVAVIAGVFVGVLGFVLTMATLLGGNYKVAKNAKIVSDYKSAYDAVAAKAQGQEEQISELKRENAQKDARISELEQHVAAMTAQVEQLKDFITGRSAIEELAGQLARMGESMNARGGEILSQLGEIRGEIRANSTKLDALAPGG